MMHDKFSVVIYFDSNNVSNFYEIMGSLFAAKGVAKNYFGIFPRYNREVYDPIFDTCEGRALDLIKFNGHLSKNKALKFVSSIVDTDYVIVLDDDVILNDENLFEKLEEVHRNPSRIVSTLSEKMSAVCLAAHAVTTLFNSEFIGHGFENAFAHRYLRNISSEEIYKFEPHLFFHSRKERVYSEEELQYNAQLFEKIYNVKIKRPLTKSLYSNDLYI